MSSLGYLPLFSMHSSANLRQWITSSRTLSERPSLSSENVVSKCGAHKACAEREGGGRRGSEEVLRTLARVRW